MAIISPLNDPDFCQAVHVPLLSLYVAGFLHASEALENFDLVAAHRQIMGALIGIPGPVTPEWAVRLGGLGSCNTQTNSGVPEFWWSGSVEVVTK